MSGFLSRWSRLKRGEAQAPAAEPVPVEAPLEVPLEAPEAAPFDLAQLPPLESLTAESDLTLFLHKAVPEGLRQAALRRIWALDPAIRDFVGPVDYAWDFNAPGGVPGIAERMSGDVARMLARVVGAGPAAAAPQSTAATLPEAQHDALHCEMKPATETSPVKYVPTKEEIGDLAEPAPPRRKHGGARPNWDASGPDHRISACEGPGRSIRSND